MKESSQIALTFAKSFLSRVERENKTLQDGHMHLHVPEVCVCTYNTIIVALYLREEVKY